MSAHSRWIHSKYTVEFLTPAFLGGADQSGQWRTPPFKALLRQWWRVAYAAQCKYQVDVQKMREAEGRLFGNAWLTQRVNGREETAASRSLVRLRLQEWQNGTLSRWPSVPGGPVYHPEVQRTSFQVDAHLYLGFGPLEASGQQSRLSKKRVALDKGETATLEVTFPKLEARDVESALALLNLYGAIGGRSRNGWGSFRLIPEEGAQLQTLLPLRDWRAALALDWPHCIGKDEQGALIWRTVTEYSDWKELMRDLACLKIALRTQFRWTNQVPDARHWLAYPVTKHKVDEWESRREGRQRRALNLRLPNALRFKIRCVNGDPQRLIGVIFHMPCSPPPEFGSTQAVLAKVWREIHQLLDELGKPVDRRQLPKTLRPTVIQQIEGVMLQRTEE